MKGTIFIVSLFFSTTIITVSSGQDSQERVLSDFYIEFTKYFDNGDFINAEKSVLKNFQYPLNEYQKSSAYGNYATLYFSLGRFDDAIAYLKKIEKLNLSSEEKSVVLPITYILEATIHEKRRSYYQAIDYTEKAIRIYQAIKPMNNFFRKSLAAAYHNLGNYHMETGDFNIALNYLDLSMKLKEDYDLPEKSLTLTSIARTYVGLDDTLRAELFFKQSIETCLTEYGTEYYRLADLYFNYGDFLQKTGRVDDAAVLFRSGLKKYLKIYGEKNNKTSYAYSLLAKNHLIAGHLDSSLYYYQRSLIAIVNDFDDIDITKNPLINSSFLDVRLLENLKGKSEVLEIYAENKNGDDKLKNLELSLETIESAIDLVDIIRNNYPSEEIMIYLTGNEKPTYMTAIRIASKIYSLTGNQAYVERMYAIALRAKAAVLRNQITGNNLLYSSVLPDTLRKEQLRLSSDIAGYNKLLLEEINKSDRDTSKINIWKDLLFELNKEKDKLSDSISASFPQYATLLRKTVPMPPDVIQRRLERDEIIIDYFISRPCREGKRVLYTFMVSGDDISFIESVVDSAFQKNAKVLQYTSDPSVRSEGYCRRYSEITSALHYFYLNLVKPLEGRLHGDRLIIIPDEEINRLSFDSFISEPPAWGKNDFDGLHFLLNDYVFSYVYSASLLPERTITTRSPSVFSFSPAYSIESGQDYLEGAEREIMNIKSLLKNKLRFFNEATKESFLDALKDSAIFHLAMHSISDSSNSLYSYLLFDSSGNSDESARLYNYEISFSNINSPLIILSSCNSGTGNLYSGEGELSLARSFILAGASSVVRTAWEVNDDSGSEIITRFYHYLTRGMSKDRALQQAKLDFIKSSSPALRDPYYWAAYEILGDNGSVVRNRKYFVTIVTIMMVLACCGSVYYFRRRRILAAGSR